METFLLHILTLAWYNDLAKEPAKTMADTQKNTRRDAALRVSICAYLPLLWRSSHLLTKLPTTLAATDTRKPAKISTAFTPSCCQYRERQLRNYTSIRQNM